MGYQLPKAQYLFQIDLNSDRGWFILDAGTTSEAKERAKMAGLLPCFVDSCAVILEEYNGHFIIYSNRVFEVFDPAKNTRFIAALDDSTLTGQHAVNELHNNVKACRSYIDHKTNFTQQLKAV